MSSTSPPPHHHPFQGFDQSVERAVGADMRLMYGMAAPILMIVGLIVVLALSPAVWLVATIVVLEIAGLGLVVTGIFGMLDEDPAADDGVD